jgi:hypothetical protein
MNVTPPLDRSLSESASRIETTICSYKGIVERFELLALDYHLGRGKLKLNRAGDIVVQTEKVGVGKSPAVACLGLQFKRENAGMTRLEKGQRGFHGL